ncbi:MAG: glycosyltransferase family 2 protein [Bacteroidetes bacterium]|nr:glycosyltransferase family 2 protein [Bacteroidota bacterium]
MGDIPLIELSIVTPGYNEGAKIRENLFTIKTFLDESFGNSWELIFVNDGSTDDTYENVSNLPEMDPRIKIITYNNNRGRGYALRQGIKRARGEFVLTTESDLNWGVEIIRELYNAINNSRYDLIVASPYCKGGELKNVPAQRAFLSRWGNKILSASVSGQVSTVSGMTRIYRRDCIQSLPLVSEDKEIHLEILSKALALGYKVSEIPATLAWPEKKVRKKSNRKSSFKAKKYIISHLTFSFFERPLLLFGLLGGGSFLVGVILGLYIVYLRFSGNLNPDRPLITLVVLMVLGGLFMFSFGLIGMQINDLRKEIYRIQSKLRNEK